MRWANQLWDKFDDVTNHLNKSIEFSEKYCEFLKKRCSIENEYAKNLRKLIKSYETKKKDEDCPSYEKCFDKMLIEIGDIAGQHELVSEKVNENILPRMNQHIKTCKEERKNCIETRETFWAEFVPYQEMIEKSRSKCIKYLREVEKAKEVYEKLEKNEMVSKSDIKKQEMLCEQKVRLFDSSEADYARQIIETNKAKNLFYNKQLPSIFNDLENLEKRRISQFKNFVSECVKIDLEMLPLVKECLNEIQNGADLINPDADLDLVVFKYQTGYKIPPDLVFESIKQAQDEQPKRAISQINLFDGINLSRSLENLASLPPAQIKNKMAKNIQNVQNELDKLTKEKNALLRMKELYLTNRKYGDSKTTEIALKTNEEKVANVQNQFERYKKILNHVESYLNENNIPEDRADNSNITQADCSFSSVESVNESNCQEAENIYVNEQNLLTAVVLDSYEADQPNSLTIEKGESLTVVKEEEFWTLVIKSNGEQGYVPRDYIQIKQN